MLLLKLSDRISGMPTQKELRAQLEQHLTNLHPYGIRLENIAQAMVDTAANVKSGERVLLWYEEGPGIPLVAHLNRRCMAKGAEISYFQRDLTKFVALAEGMSVAEVRQSFGDEGSLIKNADKMLIVRASEDATALQRLFPEKREAFNQGYLDAHAPRFDGKTQWSLLLYPTRY